MSLEVESANQVNSPPGLNPVCPYCSGRSRFFVSSPDRNRRTTAAVFTYFQCCNCKLVFMDPIPPDVTPFYRDGYQPIPASLAELRGLAAQERYRMDPILRYKKTGRLLEIGPWIGLFSCNAKDAGFDVTAIEMNALCVEFLNKTVGIRAVESSGPAQAMAELNESFDVIALWHSLEHLKEPWRLIRQASHQLTPGGLLVIAIPNIESYQYCVLKSAWKHLDAPRHLFFYPIESLTALCRKHGLSALEITTTDELSDALSRDTWHTLANSIIPVRYARGILASVFRVATRNQERKTNAGAGLTAIFQRPDEDVSL